MGCGCQGVICFLRAELRIAFSPSVSCTLSLSHKHTHTHTQHVGQGGEEGHGALAQTEAAGRGEEVCGAQEGMQWSL